MSSKLKKVGIPVAIIAVAIAVAAGMIAGREPPEKTVQENKAFLVDTTAVYKQDLNFVVNSQGTVLPKYETTLSSQVSGKIMSLSPNFIEGGMFKKGDVLLMLEQDDYLTALKTAEAELARAKAAYEEEEARGKVAAEEWKSVKNSVAPELGLRKPQLAKEKANVLAAEAQLELAKRNLARTEIRAPYDGMVKSKLVDVGHFVTTGSQLGVIYGTEVAEVRLPLSDNDLAYLELPSAEGEASVVLSAKVAGQQMQWSGKLVRNEGVVDQQSRVIYAVVEVPDPYARNASSNHLPLKFGRFVKAEIQGNHAEDMVVLPRSVLRLDGSVLVVDTERKLRIREVQVQKADEKFVYIQSGLEQGELVTTSAVPNPVDGMAVRLPTDDDSGDENEPVATATAMAGDAQ
ncbi:efflux RND transporter periplasmic adaptor subunit [Aliiglaciecola sp. CAU 1673]|uniref:efflux RND transporter periplasmic adaptor subunit n=1 Tax=Aliiglaciecola sp. CAU 1673 TaxID=3032595 RepID=UPI0023DB9DBE|nr:efflux RND transporter periplasmic adaptor subunit [Aliiglaciecola sp. CAU 1673]MDF2177225.1 efflux RND transporter periplasmic adaptor subunit [Aliiglaciecola sp. CAU 1673]